MAESINFDNDTAASLPGRWSAGVTGRGAPKWAVEVDSSAPVKPNVLKQSGSGTFPYCVLTQSSLADGYVEVKFKPLTGDQDQASGIIWRLKGGHIAGAGAVGVWTKADSVTLFDDFSYGFSSGH